jgi:predicted transposase YbfD/YdcC
MSIPQLSIQRYFGKLKDPRINRRKLHLLIDIIVIAICAVISGCEDWQQIEVFAKCRHDWFKQFLALPNGIPSHDTFERVFERLDPKAFQACFRQWITVLSEKLKIKHIAIDGKTLRGSGTSELGMLHLVSAWATEQHLSLAQVATDAKSNEITAIPQLLDLLELHGAFVSIDAMGCQKAIAAKIIERGGAYALTVKDNQPHLLEDIQGKLLEAFETNFAGMQYEQYEEQGRGHGRKEKRLYTILLDPEGIRNQEEWKELNVIGACFSTREVDGKVSEEVRYFIGSRVTSAKQYAKVLRNHWGIENNLHWQMDVNFAEDANRVSKRNAAENLALVRRLALMLLKRHPSKRSIPCKQLNAALDTAFLEEILQHSGN